MGSLVDTIYRYSPIWAQNAGVSVWGLWWYKRRFGKHFKEAVRDIRSRDRWNAAQFKSYQEHQLARLFEAAQRSPHYRKVFSDIGYRPGEPPFEVLRRMPLLSKQELRTKGRELLTEKPPRDVLVFKSSGTTGTPTELFFTRNFHQTVQAYFEARNRNWAGVTYRDRRVMFGVRKVCRQDQAEPPFWRHSPAERLAYCSIYHLSPQNLPAYVDFLREFKPRVVMGYPNSLMTLAKFIVDGGHAIPPARAIITTSETVTDEIRRTLETAFGCPLRDNYCAVEACMLGTQCEHGRYHMSPDFGVFELLNTRGEPCQPGEIGRAICTGLGNTLQPLIRYEIGDAVAWSTETSCPCGRQMPLIQSIEGRVEDMCYTADGREVLRFDTVFKGISSIAEGQVIQEALDHFVIKLVPAPGFSDADRKRLVDNMRIHVGDVRTDIETVSEIPRSSGGKFRPVVCKLKSKPVARASIAHKPLNGASSSMRDAL